MNIIKVGLIDSGVSANNVSQGNIVDTGFCNSQIDTIGHGSVCAHLISSVTKNTQIYNIKVVDSSRLISSKRLIDAIDWCISNKIDVINLSISLTDMSYFYDFEAICNKAYMNECYIIASASNIRFPSLPAYLKNVIGVASADISEHQLYYKKGCSIQYFANGTPPKKIRGGACNSFATARVTGLLCKIAEELPSKNLKQAFAKLKKLSLPAVDENLIPPIAPFVLDKKLDSLRFNQVVNIASLLKQNQKIFIGTPKECDLLRQMGKYTLFSEVISILDIIRDGESNPSSLYRFSKTLFILGDIAVNGLEKFVVSNNKQNKFYALFPPEYKLRKHVKYIFKIEFQLHKYLNRIKHTHVFIDKKQVNLFINLTYLDLLPLELYTKNIFSIAQKEISLLSASPMAAFCGLPYIVKENTPHADFCKYIRALKEVENIKEPYSLWSTIKSPYQYMNNNFDADFALFASFLQSFCPDMVFLVVDKFTQKENLEKTINCIECFTRSSINAAIFVCSNSYFNLDLGIRANKKNTAPFFLDVLDKNRGTPIPLVDIDSFELLLNRNKI